jgi:hypothetical protein
MGFLDRAKKLAEQAMGKAEEVVADIQSKAPAPSPSPSPSSTGPAPSGASDPRWGTSYVPGMLGRPGWRERGFDDPAAVLPIAERDRAGVPRSTKSEIREEPFGMGRRWSSGGRSTALYYQLYPEHHAWEPPAGRHPYAAVGGAWTATLDDGRALVFLGGGEQRVVLEATGLDADAIASLARTVAARVH